MVRALVSSEMVATVALLLGCVCGAQAAVRLGPVYPIAEPDLLEHIAARLRAMEQNGQMEQLKREFIARSRRNIEEPKGAALPRTAQGRAWLIDPSYTLERDLADAKGTVFARAGERVNPLERGDHLRQPLLFLDASDASQRQALPNLLTQYPQARLILVAGKWRDVSQQIGRRVYFDQAGKLVRQFGIATVPAVVTQQGLMLKVTELTP
jgi:conjugal transfer pilus assembly protein TraW